jgi:O-antigen/teichoic acid export membrane protein
LQQTRTTNTFKNASFGFFSQILNIALSFISRTVFIYVLGVEYLGINGLFTNIFILLSFAELGIGNAIIYGMYKPLAIGDKEKLKSLMTLYKKAYKTIGLIVFISGLLVIPFMDYIIKDAPNITENVIFIYFLFLVNTSLSYLFVYKKSILAADQKNYVILFYQQLFKLGQTIAQILFLILTGEYLLFLIIEILTILLNNIYISIKTDKMYPFLKDGKSRKLYKHEKDSIFNNIKALFIYKFGSVILNGTDNILISAIIGITAVGLNSNYVLIITAFTTIIGQVMNGFTASVGNLNAIEKNEKKENIFNKIFFFTAWIIGFFSIGLYLFLNQFIVLWLGESYLFDNLIVFSIILHFYVNGLHSSAYTYRVTMGLFTKGKLAPFAAAIINIILSIWLGNKIGIAGIFFATSVARLITTGIVDPVLVFRIGFQKSPYKYFIKYFLFIGLFVTLYYLIKSFLSLMVFSGFLGFFLEVIIFSILFNLIMLGIFWRYNVFIGIRKIIVFLIFKR